MKKRVPRRLFKVYKVVYRAKGPGEVNYVASSVVRVDCRRGLDLDLDLDLIYT